MWRCQLGLISFKMVIKAKGAGGRAHEMNQSSGSQLEAVLFPMGKFVWSHFWLLKLGRGGTKRYWHMCLVCALHILQCMGQPCHKNYPN